MGQPEGRAFQSDGQADQDNLPGLSKEQRAAGGRVGLSGVKVASAGVVGGQIRATKWEADYVDRAFQPLASTLSSQCNVKPLEDFPPLFCFWKF